MTEKVKDSREIQNELIDNLLRGTITPSEFIQSILKLDQATPDHQDSELLRLILVRLDIKAKFRDGRDYVQYANVLSIVTFHVAQRMLLIKKNKPKALEHFKGAAYWAKESGDVNDEWLRYVEGTIAYINSDLESLKTAAERVSPGPNRNILLRFIARLEKGQRINYRKDYDGSSIN